VRLAIAALLWSQVASAETLGASASAGLRLAQHGGVAPAFGVAVERPFGPVTPFVGLEAAQLSRDAEAEGVPFSLIVRELALVAGVSVQRGRPFAQAGLRLAAQSVRSSTSQETQRDTGLGLGGALAVGWSWPQGFTLAFEVVVDPMASPLTGDTWVISAGPRAGYRWGASRR